MTNEQAIEWLKDYIQNTPFQMEQYERAFDMAIQALSQEPCEECKYKTFTELYFHTDPEMVEQEPCDDAISRKTLLTNLYQYKISCAGRIQAAILEIEELVEKMPPVTQKSETVTEFADRCRECGARYGKLLKQKTGHWIYDETIENWRCSKCNETPKTMGYVGTADFMAEHFKFCNHCGAKMVEPQESENKE